MRATHIIELAVWCTFAALFAYFQSEIVILALQVTFGSLQDVPASVLQNLMLISPVFPTLIGVLALVRLMGSGLSIGEILGLRSQHLGSDLAIGIGVGVLSVAITAVSLRLVSNFIAVPPLGAMPKHAHLYFATIGALLPGFFEEVYFRRLLMKLGASLPVALSLLISAATFAVWHIGSPAYLVHTFILGLIWGALFVRTGRLFPAIVAHCSANSLFGFALFLGLPVL